MQIKDVEALAELSKIELTEEEKQGLLKDFESILAYVDTIKSAEVEDAPLHFDLYNRWREDAEKSQSDFSAELLTAQFGDSQPARPDDLSRSGGDGIFLKVKKIL